MFYTNLNAVAFPCIVSEHKERDARTDAGEEAVEEPALTQVVGVAIDETGCAKCSAAA